MVHSEGSYGGNRMIEISSVAPADVPRIREFNRRVGKHPEIGDDYSLPESPWSLGVAQEAGAPIWHEIFVAREPSGDVRGGYALKRELWFGHGEELCETWNYQIPLSEGSFDKQYATLGIRLLQDAIARHPHLYCLGMGGFQRPLPRLLQRFSWTVEEVPFRFRVIRANGFLKNIAFLRTSRTKALALDVARFSGAGAAAVAAWKIGSYLRAPRYPSDFSAEEVAKFGTEADAIFTATARHYAALIDRTSAALNVRFPEGDRRLVRLIISAHGEHIGWLVLTLHTLRRHKQFGNLRLGSLVDGLCDPMYVPAVIRFAVEYLSRKGVDLIVTNQTHRVWLEALARNGFMSGPSNFIFGRSPKLAAEMPALSECHVNRGDGDGPINL